MGVAPCCPYDSIITSGLLISIWNQSYCSNYIIIDTGNSPYYNSHVWISVTLILTQYSSNIIAFTILNLLCCSCCYKETDKWFAKVTKILSKWVYTVILLLKYLQELTSGSVSANIKYPNQNKAKKKSVYRGIIYWVSTPYHKEQTAKWRIWEGGEHLELA